jgi:hypothetical protein
MHSKMNLIIKTLSTTAAFIAIAALAFSCKKKVADCTVLNNAVISAKAAYTTNQTNDNCKAFKLALSAWLAENTCTDANASLKAQYTAQNAELKCL